MSTAMWKLEKDLCRCCHAEGSFKHLSDPCFQLGQEEIYSDMLQDCLDIKIVPMTGVLSDVTYTICESCVVRLRDAANFKQQVQDCEERFKEMYSKNLIRGLAVKDEPMNESDDLKQEFQSIDEDDDDAFMNFDDDGDDSLDDQPLSVEVKPKIKGKAKAKPKPKAKKTPAKKTTKGKPIKLETEDITEAAVSGEKKKEDEKITITIKYEPYETDDAPAASQEDSGAGALGSLLRKHLTSQAKPKKKAGSSEKKNADKVLLHKCPECKNLYKSKKNMANHIRLTHRMYDCPHCPLSDTYRKLQRHLKNVHSSEGSEVVKHRGNFIRKSSKYQDFFKINGGVNTSYTCRLCEFESKERSRVINHIHGQHLREISCTVCGEVFTDPKKLEAHKSQPHPTLKYPCTSCELVLPSRAKLLSHKHCHIRRKCPFCPEKMLRVDMRKHQLDNHGDVMPTCGVCGLKAATQARIEKHQRMVHLKEKNVACDVCKFECFSDEQLKKHMISHKADRLFECKYCKKKFPRQSTCRIHEMIHTGEKKKVCAVCGAAFVQKASLNYHMIKHHPDHV